MSRSSPLSVPTAAPTATLGVTYPGMPSTTCPSHSCTSPSASSTSSNPSSRAARMSAATRSTSSKRSRSYRLSVKPSPVLAMAARLSLHRRSTLSGTSAATVRRYLGADALTGGWGSSRMWGGRERGLPALHHADDPGQREAGALQDGRQRAAPVRVPGGLPLLRAPTGLLGRLAGAQGPQRPRRTLLIGHREPLSSRGRPPAGRRRPPPRATRPPRTRWRRPGRPARR